MAEVISDVEEVRFVPARGGPRASTLGRVGKGRKRTRCVIELDSSGSGIEIEEVVAEGNWQEEEEGEGVGQDEGLRATSVDGENADGWKMGGNAEGVEVVGVQKKGVVYSHARQHCPWFEFDPALSEGAFAKNVKFCDKCFCFYCDRVANECDDWGKHCFAREGDRAWETLRRRARDMQRQTRRRFRPRRRKKRRHGGKSGWTDGAEAKSEDALPLPYLKIPKYLLASSWELDGEGSRRVPNLADA